MAVIRSRFAPTPSGHLHIGNALSFIVTWCWMRRLGGTVLLRIDDLDTDRTRGAFLDDIFDNLEWLGLDWDEGPRDRSDFVEHWSQHHRMPLYRAAIERLKEMPEVLFACTCTRGQLAQSGCRDRYLGTCRAKGLPFDTPGMKLRFVAPDGPTGDFVVWKKDGFPAYQLASLVDDEHFGVTHIVRGADLRDSTEMQRRLAGALGYESFLKVHFLHHPLVVDSGGRKFSKSDGSLSITALRQGGVTPAGIYRFVAVTLGLPSSIETARDLLDACDEATIAAFDVKCRGAEPIPVTLR